MAMMIVSHGRSMATAKAFALVTLMH